MAYTIKQLAVLAHVSVRTLQYYDGENLLNPSYVEKNGYRKYEEKELLRLQQILFFKELDFSLEEIKKIISSPDFDMMQAFKDHKKMIIGKRDRLNKLLETLDNTIKKMKHKKDIKDHDLYKNFDESEVDEYKEEVKQRWGNTLAYKQSQERTKNWTKEDYTRIKKENEELMQKIVKKMHRGYASPEIQLLIEEWRSGINRFYDTTLQMCRNLGEMYVSDPRFTATYEKYAPGMAVFMRDAIVHYVEEKSKKVK